MFSKILIELAGEKNITLCFDILQGEIQRRWIHKVMAAQRLQYPIDDPERFYGFDDPSQEIQVALDLINRDIQVINQYQPIIHRNMTRIDDQDTLNYLHNIFERYHGLLDQQQHDFWLSAPESVQRALALLNVHVHRCESVGRGSQPRMVVTWYGLPKRQCLRPRDYDLMTNEWKFGSVYLNYVEIGKTLEEMAQDQDTHIGDDAFRPFRHFSADFNIKFFDADPQWVQMKNSQTLRYFEHNQHWFESRGYSKHDPRLRPGSIELARIYLDGHSPQEIIDRVRQHRFIKAVTLE